MAGDSLVFNQGQTGTLTAQFVASPSGAAVDVPDAQVQIFGPGGEVILAATNMTHVMTGFYYYDWLIPTSLPPDTYTARYTGTVLGTPTAATEYVMINAAGTPGVAISSRAMELVTALDVYLSCAQRIPVYNELARRTNNSYQVYQLTWPRWNLGNHCVFQNNEIITNPDVPATQTFVIDADTGTITFSTPRHNTDKILATYNFRMFSIIEELRFLSDALSQINIEAPGTNYTLDTVPDMYVGTLMMGATKNALKRMLLCLQFQEPSTIFGPNAKDAIAAIERLKENNEKEFTADKKQVKKAFYPKMSAVVGSVYTLPGGRCLRYDSTGEYVLNGERKTLTIEEAFGIISSGSELLVGCNLNGKYGLSRVSKIWKTGRKQSLRIESSNGKLVHCSQDHLVFSSGIYVPAKSLVVGDELRVRDGRRIGSAVITSIDLEAPVPMYDMEVPDAENFFCNGIQCHNSRWFRYLYSSGI
jgi:hypothetical protein